MKPFENILNMGYIFAGVMNLRNAEITDINSIIDLAHISWHDTYKAIITEEQIHFMLQKFYKEDLLFEHIASRQDILRVLETNEGELIGYSHTVFVSEQQARLSKIYFYPQYKGQGLGSYMLYDIENILKEKGIEFLVLNVNRNNPALHFYLKKGFSIIETVDIPLDTFFLNDYVMQKKL